MTPATDTAVNSIVADELEAMPNATALVNLITTMPSNIIAELHLIPLPAETDNKMSDVDAPTANVDEVSRPGKSDEVSEEKSQT